jgi:hypothetical protein
VARRRLRAVTGGDGCAGERGAPRTSQVSPLAVVPVEVDGVASEVHLDPGETTPPDGGQLAIRPGVPGEAKRGDRPIALAPVLRAPEGSSHGPRCRPAVPTTGPGCWTLELRACPTWRDVPELDTPKGSRRAGEPPRRPDVQPGRDPRQSDHRHERAGRLGGLAATSVIPEPTVTARSTTKRRVARHLLPRRSSPASHPGDRSPRHQQRHSDQDAVTARLPLLCLPRGRLP